MWINPISLTGRVVRLEPLEVRHAADLFAAADPELFRFTPQMPDEWSISGFEQEITRVLAVPDSIALAIIAQEGPRAGHAIGRSTFMDIKPAHRGLEIGRTWIGRAFHGTKVNPEIKYLMIRHAFEELCPTAIRVQLTTGGSNLHSQHALAKLGAVREGVLRHNKLVPSSPDPQSDRIPRDTVYFSILANEWPTVKTRLEQRIGWSGSPGV